MAFNSLEGLLAAIQRGDEVGWREFYDTYKPIIIMKGGDLGLSHAEKEELVQLVMLSFFKSSKTFRYDRSKGRFLDYFRTVVRNRACDLMRRRQDGTVSSEGLEHLLGEIPAETEDHWEREYKENVLERAFEELNLRCDPTTLRSYDLFVRENLPAKEVAARLGIKPNAVYQHKARVEAMLGQIVKELGE